MAKRHSAAPRQQPAQAERSDSLVEAAAEAVGRAAGQVIVAVKGMRGTGGKSGRLQDAFLEELKDAYDAEKQLVKALPRLARAATAPALRSTFETHLDETRGHVEKLEQVFALCGQRVQGKHCDGIAGIVEEGSAVIQDGFEKATMDACLIAAGQRVEHYEMAAYGTLAAWAKVIGRADAANILQAILDEEKAADAKLNALAEGGINQEAAAAANTRQNKDANGQSNSSKQRSTRPARRRRKANRHR
jgi:ferritin-like metal-binding protein YciE